jgi:hypothetical protein
MESTDAKGMLHDVVAKLKMKRDGLQKALAQTEAEIQAVETTLTLLSQNGSRPDYLTAIAAERAYDFKGKSQRECLIEIAKRNAGVLKVSEAKRILTLAGVLKKTRNAWGSVHTTLSRSKEFEKTGTGVFHLIGYGSGVSDSATAAVTKALVAKPQ